MRKKIGGHVPIVFTTEFAKERAASLAMTIFSTPILRYTEIFENY